MANLKNEGSLPHEASGRKSVFERLLHSGPVAALTAKNAKNAKT
jgi:hypothetical protein